MYFDKNGNMILWGDIINGLNGTLLNKTNTSKEEKHENKQSPSQRFYSI